MVKYIAHMVIVVTIAVMVSVQDAQQPSAIQVAIL